MNWRNSAKMGEIQKRDLMMELYNFIKDGNLENDLLMKDKKLSILSSHLFSLNKVFATYNSSEILDSARREAVEFLRDFCFRIPTLKLVHTPDSAPGAIDVSRLHSLTHLEIGKAPVHLLTGLRALRQQLQVLICTRCLHSVEILIGQCGGDKAEEQDWPHLHTLNLSFNYLTNIDASLQLLPSLRVIDLSHNQIKTTGVFLESLPELQHVNLSYNCLSMVPSLGQVSHRKLKSLNLRNNNLQYLDGIHLFENLEFLDLSRNCIYSEQPLNSLNYVWQICKIYLRGNPITQEPLYREMVTKNLPPATAFRTVYLDGYPLSEEEIKKIPTQRKSAFYSFPRGGDQPASELTKSVQFGDLSIDSFEDSADYSSSGPSKPLRTKDRRKKRTKVRQVIISDQAQKEDLPTVTPKSFENSHLEEAKREFERKREEHGSDWLLALQDPFKTQAESARSTSPFVEVQFQVGTPETMANKPDLQERVANGRGGFDQEVVVTAEVEVYGREPQSEDYVDAGEIDKTERKNGKTDAGREDIDSGNIGIKSTKGMKTTDVKMAGTKEIRTQQQKAEDNNLVVVEVNGLEPVMETGGTKESDNTGATSGIDLEYDKHAERSAGPPLVVLEEHDKELERLSSEEDLCGPLLVKVARNNDFTEIFLTVKQSHLEESDLNGEVQERLELKSLLSVDVSEKQVPEEGMVPVVALNFEYVRKDRRARHYHMEDHTSAEMLSGVLETFWQENQQKSVTHYMSCLKCAKEFPLSKAVMVVDRPKGRKSLDQQDNALNEVPTCPYCGNRYLVEGEQHLAAKNGNPEPVIGSLTSSTKPLATSSPWNLKENGKESTSLNLSPPRYLSSTPPATYVVVQSDTTINSDETPNDSMTSMDVSLNLPESTIPSNSLEAKTPIEEVAHYSRDQLDNLLKSDKSEFTRRYSLVQQVSEDGSANRMSVTSQQDASPLPARAESTKRKTNRSAGEDIYGGKSELSEDDDFDILDDPQDMRKQLASEVDGEVDAPFLQGKGKGVVLAKTGEGRHDSNESDIAVISDKEHHDSDPRAWMEGSTTSTDNVFGAADVDSSAYHSRKSSSKSGSEREDDGSGFQSSGERKKTDSGINGSTESEMKDKRERKISMMNSIQDNYRYADHRLKLFYSMSLFSSDDEEFQCHIAGSICTNSMLGYVSYDGLVVVSTSHLYILKVIKEESDKPADFLSKKFQFPIQELLYIHIGLGSQLIQFEFTPDGGGRFALLIGDRLNVENFTKLLQDCILSKNMPKFQGIERHHPSSKKALSDLFDEDDDLNDWSRTFFVHGLDPRLKDSFYMRRCILVTEQFIYLIDENCSWPLVGEKSLGKVTTRGQHFTLKEHFSITDITDVDCNLRELKVFINFSDEDEDRESHWELKMLTPSSMRQMLNAINKPWSEQFGVDLTVSYIGE